MTSTITVEATLTLDLRSIPVAERPMRVLESFDRLAAAERVVLVSPDSGGAVLRRLQRERGGLFEWSVLAPGAGVRRIELVRRAEAVTLRSVDEALSWDHDRLDALENAAFARRATGDLSSASALYAEFATGLRRHIGFEEEVLFPVFEERAGFPRTAGPTAVMRAEHRQIEELLGLIEAGMAGTEAPVEALRRRFQAVLGDHNFKEEHVLYPGVDQVLGPEQADALVARIQRFDV